MGAKVIVTAHFPSTAIVLLQVFDVTVNSDELLAESARDEIFSVDVPILLSVSVFCEVAPAAALKEKLLSLRLRVGVVEVPVKATVTGLPAEELLAIESVALKVPTAVGVKVIVTAQLAPAASVEPQPFVVIEKRAESVPDSAREARLNVPLPVLLRVALCCALEPTSALKARLLLLRLRVAASEVPFSVITVVYPVEELLAIDSVAAKEPVATGVKPTVRVQLEPAVSVVPQLFVTE